VTKTSRLNDALATSGETVVNGVFKDGGAQPAQA